MTNIIFVKNYFYFIIRVRAVKLKPRKSNRRELHSPYSFRFIERSRDALFTWYCIPKSPFRLPKSTLRLSASTFLQPKSALLLPESTLR